MKGVLVGLDLAVLAVASGLLVLLVGVYRRRWAKGRLITAPLARRLRKPALEARTLTLFCMSVLFVAIVGASLATRGVIGVVGPMVVNGLYAAIFADDLLTGDDARWRRWKSRARNAVRWRMKLPAPARPQPTA